MGLEARSSPPPPTHTHTKFPESCLFPSFLFQPPGREQLPPPICSCPERYSTTGPQTGQLWQRRSSEGLCWDQLFFLKKKCDSFSYSVTIKGHCLSQHRKRRTGMIGEENTEAPRSVWSTRPWTSSSGVTTVSKQTIWHTLPWKAASWQQHSVWPVHPLFPHL